MTTSSDKTGSTGSGSGAAAARPATATAAPAAAQPAAAAPAKAPAAKRPGRVRRFFRSLLSHLVFAAVITMGVLGYLYHAQILRNVGDRVCAENMLGQFMTEPSSGIQIGKAAGASDTRSAGHRASSTSALASGTTQNADDARSTAPASVAAAEPKPAIQPVEIAKPQEQAADKAQLKTASASPAPAAQPSSPPATEPAVKAAPEAAEAPVLQEDKSVAAAAPAATAGQPAAASQPVARAPEAQPAASEPVASRGVENATAIETAAATTAAVASTAATTEAAAATQPATATAATEAAAATSPAAQRAPSPRSGLSLAKSWQAAREAYAAGKPEAISAYQELAAAFPDMPELTGELGNIYYAQKRYDEAAEQYLQTAKRLIKQDREMEASCLADVLAQLAPDKAQVVRSLTSAPCQRRR